MIETAMADVYRSGSSKVITAEQAAALIEDGITICSPIIGLSGWPEEIGRAIAKRYQDTGHPKGLTLVCGSAMGNHKDKGPHVMGIEGLITKFIGAHTHGSPHIGALIQNNKMLAYCFPQGIVVQLYREIAAKRPGILSKVGLGTFVDPRIEGGKMNDLTRKAPDLNEVVTFAGEEYLMTLTTEVGCVGGVPAGWPNFGMTYNAEAFVDHPNMFDWYDGGGIDRAFLGMGEVDKFGNANVSKFDTRPIGCGGFINITTTSKEVVFCGTFTTGGLKVTVEDGRLRILQEGRRRKFLDHVEQITFSGKYAAKANKSILYVTERAVFRLIGGEVTLIEIAPGIDLERDVLAHMDFKPRIAPGLKSMPQEIFYPVWGKLKELISSKR